jgi:protein-L-isoaspartate(D-aspartate) O-methyltransferase
MVAGKFSIEQCRRFFAEEMRAVAGLQSPELVRAFAAVHRERFLGPPPWFVASWNSMGPLRFRPVEDARELYHDLFVSLRPVQNLNNGSPGVLARMMNLLDLRAGRRVLHVGCGTGYYTAILAETVGETGAVTALEIEPELAAEAARNLAPWKQATVLNRDGSCFDPGPVDAILVNASVTRPNPAWLSRLREGGVLLLPLAVARSPLAHDTMIFRVECLAGGWAAEASSILTLYPCAGLRDAAEQAILNRAFESHDLLRVRSLRSDAHESCASCVAHAPTFCLSALDPATEPGNM